MARTSFDQFSKQFLEALLSPFGQVEISREVPGEPRFVDVWFAPTQPTEAVSLGLLGQMATIPCLLEPFRNPPAPTEIRQCLLKLLAVQAQAQRQARREAVPLPEAELPYLWILTPSLSEKTLISFGAHESGDWPAGVYLLEAGFRAAIVLINQLPVTAETLWVRLLGKGKTQQQAIAQVAALPTQDGRREVALRLLVTWKLMIEESGLAEEQEILMSLSSIYLEWERETERRGLERGLQRERSLVLRLLQRKLGELSPVLQERVQQLSIEQLESLGEALLDFSSQQDLQSWLEAR